MENSNWSNREIHTPARWLFTYGYGEQIRSSRVGGAGVPPSQVVWTELADHFRCGIPGYADMVRAAGTISNERTELYCERAGMKKVSDPTPASLPGR